MSDHGPAPMASLLERSLERRRIAREAEQALDHVQLSLWLQPIVELGSGRIIAAEARVLAPRAADDSLSPNTFMSTAHREGTSIGPVGRWVLTNACSEIEVVRRQSRRKAVLGVSVNVSAMQLSDPTMVDDVAMAFRVSGLAPADLCLEITHAEFLAELAPALESLDRLHGMGVRSALDNCWAGYESALFIQHFGIDTVKLNAAFVHHVCADDSRRQMVRSVINIAHSLGARVVAEGVASCDQAAALSQLHCDAAQGPYFAPPMMVTDFSSLCGREQRLWEEAETS